MADMFVVRIQIGAKGPWGYLGDGISGAMAESSILPSIKRLPDDAFKWRDEVSALVQAGRIRAVLGERQGRKKVAVGVFKLRRSVIWTVGEEVT